MPGPCWLRADWLMLRTMRSSIAALFALAALVTAAQARADRLAVISLRTAAAPPPVLQADALASHLLQQRHRTINHADAVARLQSGNEGAGSDWASGLSQTLAQARAALTRLDRHGASVLVRQVGDAIQHAGGGAGGAEVLVDWALLERSLATSSAGQSSGARWMRMAAAIGPRVALDPLHHPDDERNAFSDAVVELEKQPAAILAVTSAPAAAELWVDGVKRCSTPCSATLPAGHHYARISSPAHAPATFEIELAAGATASREVGLTAAYSGASLDAISAMFADPSRNGEASSALLSVARFLDVDHVVALAPEPSGTLRVVIAPPASGQPGSRNALSDGAVAGAVDSMLAGRTSPSDDAGATAWYSKPGVWIGVGIVVAAAAAGTIYWATRDSQQPPGKGALVIGGN